MRSLLTLGCLFAAVNLGLADDATATFAGKVDAITKDRSRAIGALNTDFLAAKTAAEKKKIRAEQGRQSSGFARQLLNLVRTEPTAPDAFKSLVTALNWGDAKVGASITDLMLEKFGHDPKLAAALPQIVNAEAGRKLVVKLAETSSDRAVKGMARYTLAEADVLNADNPWEGDPLPLAVATATFAAASKTLGEIRQEFGDVKLPAKKGPPITIAERVKNLDYFVKNLTVGHVAPDETCEQLEDGKTAKLSDYRGKIVVLDFWATWCSDCKAMIPFERQLANKLKFKPFALVSISGDDKKDAVTEFLKSEPMPWHHLWSGPTGKAVTAYNVRFWPTIYVLDAKGVIRSKHSGEERLTATIDGLQKELDETKSR